MHGVVRVSTSVTGSKVLDGSFLCGDGTLILIMVVNDHRSDQMWFLSLKGFILRTNIVVKVLHSF